MSGDDPIHKVERLRAEDIMIPLESYPTANQDDTLGEAIALMLSAEIDVEGRKSLPRVCFVTDGIGGVAGILRRRDVLRGLEPEHLVSRPLQYRAKWFNVDVDPHLSELTTSAPVKSLRERVQRPVREFMLPVRGNIEARDHIFTAINKMVTHDVPLLPVSRGGRVVGILRSVEVFSEVAVLATQFYEEGT